MDGWMHRYIDRKQPPLLCAATGSWEEEEEEEGGGEGGGGGGGEGPWGHARYRRASAHEDTSTLATVGT